MLASDVARDVAVAHVVDLTDELESIVSGGDHAVQAIGDESDLPVVFGIRGQLSGGHATKFGEGPLKTRGFLEEPKRTVLTQFRADARKRTWRRLR